MRRRGCEEEIRRRERTAARGRRESAVARERSVGRSSVKGIAVELAVGSAIVAAGRDEDEISSVIRCIEVYPLGFGGRRACCGGRRKVERKKVWGSSGAERVPGAKPGFYWKAVSADTETYIHERIDTGMF